jgi:hypothetical protein
LISFGGLNAGGGFFSFATLNDLLTETPVKKIRFALSQHASAKGRMAMGRCVIIRAA